MTQLTTEIQRDKKQRFFMCIKSLELIFNRRHETDEQAKVYRKLYLDALNDIDVRAIEYATKQAIEIEKTMPTPAKLRELANIWRRPDDELPPKIGETRVEYNQDQARLANKAVSQLIANAFNCNSDSAIALFEKQMIAIRNMDKS